MFDVTHIATVTCPTLFEARKYVGRIFFVQVEIDIFKDTYNYVTHDNPLDTHKFNISTRRFALEQYEHIYTLISAEPLKYKPTQYIYL